MLRDSGWQVDEVRDRHMKVSVWDLTPPADLNHDDPWADIQDLDDMQDASDLPTHHPARYVNPADSAEPAESAGSAGWNFEDLEPTEHNDNEEGEIHMDSSLSNSLDPQWRALVEDSLPDLLVISWHTRESGQVMLLGQVAVTHEHSDAPEGQRTAWDILAVIDPVMGFAVRIWDSAYFTKDQALDNFDVSIGEIEAWGYELDELEAVLPWLRRIPSCPL